MRLPSPLSFRDDGVYGAAHARLECWRCGRKVGRFGYFGNDRIPEEPSASPLAPPILEPPS